MPGRRRAHPGTITSCGAQKYLFRARKKTIDVSPTGFEKAGAYWSLAGDPAYAALKDVLRSEAAVAFLWAEIQRIDQTCSHGGDRYSPCEDAGIWRELIEDVRKTCAQFGSCDGVGSQWSSLLAELGHRRTQAQREADAEQAKAEQATAAGDAEAAARHAMMAYNRGSTRLDLPAALKYAHEAGLHPRSVPASQELPSAAIPASFSSFSHGGGSQDSFGDKLFDWLVGGFLGGVAGEFGAHLVRLILI